MGVQNVLSMLRGGHQPKVDAGKPTLAWPSQISPPFPCNVLAGKGVFDACITKSVANMLPLWAAVLEKSARPHVSAVPTGSEGRPFLPSEPESNSQMMIPLDVDQVRTVSF